MRYGMLQSVKVGLISAILNGLTNGPRVMIFDLLFDKKKDLSGNISIAIISVVENIITMNVSTDFFKDSA